MPSPYGFGLVESCQNCPWRLQAFFCAASTKALKAFETIKFTTAYPAGAVLFVEGEPARGVFMLCKGRVKLYITSQEGRSLVLRIVSAGEMLALDAALSGKACGVSAETLEPCQVNFFRRQDFLRFLDEHGDAAVRAARQLSSNYPAACDRIYLLGLSQSAHVKLARFLLDWSGNGQETEQGIRVKLGLTHEEIAQTIGSCRETVTRMLGEFSSKHLLTIRGSTLLIQNVAALESFASTVPWDSSTISRWDLYRGKRAPTCTTIR